MSELSRKLPKIYSSGPGYEAAMEIDKLERELAAVLKANEQMVSIAEHRRLDGLWVKCQLDLKDALQTLENAERDAARYRRARLSPAWYEDFGRKLWGEELDAAMDDTRKEIT
jgi:hypothetical protein